MEQHSMISKEERNKIYKEALKLFMEKKQYYLCLAIVYAAGLNPSEVNRYCTKKRFPELFKFKPKPLHRSQRVWFYLSDHGNCQQTVNDIRITILNECIKLTS